MRQALLLLVLVAHTAPATFAQSSASAVHFDERPSTDTKITVEVRHLIGATDLNERLCGIRALPIANSFSVRNDWQALALVFIADRRANQSAIEHPEKFTLQSGKSQAWTPLGLSPKTSENHTVCAVYLPEHKTFRLQLAWAKHKPEEDALRPMTAVVPSGHHLLVHTKSHFVVDQTPVELGIVEYWRDSLFNRPQRTQSTRMPVDDYLLLTPRLSGLVE